MRTRCDIDVLGGMGAAATSVCYLLYLSSLWLVYALNIITAPRWVTFIHIFSWNKFNLFRLFRKIAKSDY